MRLNAYLARAGVASRRRSDELIKAGRVTVNGEPGQLNTFVQSRDRVELDGVAVELQPLAYVLLHKPAGAVTTASDPQGRRTVVELVDHPARVVPVGRLDADTTGALLLTNDGELAHRLAHPRYEVEKVYEAEVEGDPTEDALEPLREGIQLDDGPTSPAQARRLGPGRVELSIHEGRKHQVKRMLAAVGHPGHPVASQPLRGADARRARARPVARARALRSGSAQDEAARACACAIRSSAARVHALIWFSLSLTPSNSRLVEPGPDVGGQCVALVGERYSSCVFDVVVGRVAGRVARRGRASRRSACPSRTSPNDAISCLYEAASRSRLGWCTRRLTGSAFSSAISVTARPSVW